MKLSEVKKRCSDGRFYKYDHWIDYLFVPPSIVLVWVFVNLKISGNSVSILSGLLAVFCGILISSSDVRLILIGSFGYAIFLLLDYADGSVSRINKKEGIGGQYVDWIMHVVTTVGMTTGLFIGAYNLCGNWIIPFGIFSVVGSALSLDKYSFAWFAIIMHFQQQKLKGTLQKKVIVESDCKKPSLIFKIIRRMCTFIFHENFAFYIYPILAILHMFLSNYYDFRVLIILFGGVIYFPFLIYDIIRLSNSSNIGNMYNNTFLSDQKPNLPDDHFFN